mmetsp:Transcript_43729/g.114936  ORF Transcript_43729/g.114936 Transcript_43729/m.114936 type:complete len:159 (+) Transcript_43729:140-616(+)
MSSPHGEESGLWTVLIDRDLRRLIVESVKTPRDAVAFCSIFRESGTREELVSTWVHGANGRDKFGQRIDQGLLSYANWVTWLGAQFSTPPATPAQIPCAPRRPTLPAHSGEQVQAESEMDVEAAHSEDDPAYRSLCSCKSDYIVYRSLSVADAPLAIL